MPAKGSSYKSGKRNVILDKKFFNSLRETTGLDIDDDIIRQIVIESNLEIAESIKADDDGFKLPENLGYIVVTKYKSKKKPVDWVNTHKYKKKIYLTNLHSFGYIHHIKWYKRGVTSFAFKDVYKLQPARLLTRDVAKSVKSGKLYHSWSNDDFLSKNKILKKLHKD